VAGSGQHRLMDICPRCGSGMLGWRHSAAWRAFTCWACHFVTFERAEDAVQETRRPDAPVVATPVVQVVRLPRCDFVVIVPDEAEGRAIPGRCGCRLAPPGGAAGGPVHGEKHGHHP
jgi:ribosomal protein S27AE